MTKRLPVLLALADPVPSNAPDPNGHTIPPWRNGPQNQGGDTAAEVDRTGPAPTAQMAQIGAETPPAKGPIGGPRNAGAAANPPPL